jgi:hypothetical protein
MIHLSRGMVALIIGQYLRQLVRSWRAAYRANRLFVRQALSLELLTRRLVVALIHLRLLLYNNLASGGHSRESLLVKVVVRLHHVACLALHQRRWRLWLRTDQSLRDKFVHLLAAQSVLLLKRLLVLGYHLL